MLEGTKPGKESRGDVSIKDTRIRIGRKDDLDRSQWTLASKGGEDSSCRLNAEILRR